MLVHGAFIPNLIDGPCVILAKSLAGSGLPISFSSHQNCRGFPDSPDSRFLGSVRVELMPAGEATMGGQKSDGDAKALLEFISVQTDQLIRKPDNITLFKTWRLDNLD